MRVSLRLGLVELDDEEASQNRKRAWVSYGNELRIRSAVHKAVGLIIKKSGVPMSLIDQKLWMARKYCPEMFEPDCPKCVFSTVCKKRTELFQPVLRTTAY